ncbi:MAG: helix-turn-helix domain-containing protein [Candidatus Pacebacteria bacterium]|nr:helix-turn-helix domain-containing protein [Candidatus Paceibacterota bacterium]
MVKRKEKILAIKLRKEGKSYSQIQGIVKVSKGTLSDWLKNYPLSRERLIKLRDKNPKRIENYRNTCQKRRGKILKEVYNKVKKDIGKFSKRDLFIAGLFMYWGEGTKTFNTATSISNTDPAVLKLFIKWLNDFGIDKKSLRIKLHLYSDMNIKKETKFWVDELSIPISQFRNPYIKKNEFKDITYRKGKFGHGTCNVLFYNRQFNDYILTGLVRLQEIFK